VAELNSLKVIEKVASKIAPGRIPSFTEIHVIKALETIGSEGAIGRKRLSELLGFGEGATRTLVRHLKLEGLIKTSKSGIALSRFGEKVFSELKSRISGGVEIPESPLAVGPFNVAVLIRNVAHLIKYGLEQRDAVVKVGALGATTLIFRRDKLTVPGVREDFLKDTQSIYETLVTKLEPREDDVIIIGSANEKRSAEFGAKAAAYELLKTKNRKSTHTRITQDHLSSFKGNWDLFNRTRQKI